MTSCPVHPAYSPYCPACITAKRDSTAEVAEPVAAEPEAVAEPAHADETNPEKE